MNKSHVRGRRGWTRRIPPLLILFGLSLFARGVVCPSCQEPNPDYDPDDPYESDPPCIPCCENESCGTCRCCEDGECVHYPDTCPNPPPEPSVNFVKVGPCPCTDPIQAACTAPVSESIPMPDISVCLQDCTWVAIVDSITVEYLEGLCPDNCKNTIESANDVDSGNYCAVKDAIQERMINISPQAPPPVGQPGQEDYCFAACLQANENVHVGQLDQEWALYWNLILDDIDHISVPFDCDTTRSESQARAEMLHSVAESMLNNYANFLNAWNIPDRGEADAAQAELACLQNLANQIQQMATANGWKCP